MFFRTIPETEDHRAPHRHHGAEERADHVGLQGRGPAGADDRVVQRRRAAEDPAQRGRSRRRRRQRGPVAEGHLVGRLAVFPARGAQQEGAGQRRVLVRGEKCGRHGGQPERDPSSSRYLYNIFPSKGAAAFRSCNVTSYYYIVPVLSFCYTRMFLP